MQIPKPVMHGIYALCSFECCPSEGTTSAGEVATRMGLPSNQAAKILGTLALNGLLEAQQGRGGGFRLAHPLEEVTMADVARALGFDNDRRSEASRACPIEAQCGCDMYAELRRLHDEFWRLMENMTLDSLVKTRVKSMSPCV